MRFSFSAILMSVCAVILAGLQGKYAFYAAMPVALTFGKKFKNFILLYSVDVRVYANHKVFSLRAAFSPTPVLTNLVCICWKNCTITVQNSLWLNRNCAFLSADANQVSTATTTTKQKIKRAQVLMGQNVVLIVNTPTPRTNLDVAAELL